MQKRSGCIAPDLALRTDWLCYLDEFHAAGGDPATGGEGVGDVHPAHPEPTRHTGRRCGRPDRFGTRLCACRVRRRAVSATHPYAAAEMQHYDRSRCSVCTARCPSGGYLLRDRVARPEWEPLQHAGRALDHFVGERGETEDGLDGPAAGQGRSLVRTSPIR